MNKVLNKVFLALGAACMCLLLIGCGKKAAFKVVNDCVVDEEAGGQYVTCNGGTIYVPDRNDIIEIIDPCGDGPGEDEVLLKFADETYLAWYKNLGLVALTENVQYQTTDAQKCRFTIVNGQVVY